MKLKKLISIILISVILPSSALSCSISRKGSFDVNNILSIIGELTSKPYQGRLVGNEGNVKAQEYIEKYFKKIGLEPGGDNNGFLQSFDIVVPSIEDSCHLKVLDKNNKLIKQYEYGLDFKENPYGASAEDTVYGSPKTELSEEGDILLLANGRIGEQPVDYEVDIALKKKGIRAIIYPTNMNYRFRSPYKLQADYPEGIAKILVTSKVFDELVNYSKMGYKLEIKSSLDIKKVKAQNVIGILKGKNPSLPPLILSAHFDHVGMDADGTLYPGALDNASGTAMLLECARVLKSYGPYDRTIVFAAFNGEEVGLVGSEYFVKNPPFDISKSECINFDMVAGPKDMPLSILSYGSDNSFSRELELIAKDENINTNLLYNNNSDHAPFCINGIRAVTLIYDDSTKIHTPKDDLKNIDAESTKVVFSLVFSYLKSRNVEISYSDKSQNLDGNTLVMPSIIIVALGVVLILNRRNLHKKS